MSNLSTPIDYSFIDAVRKGDIELAAYWLNRGAALDGQPQSPVPLIEAAHQKKPFMVQWLLDQGASVTQTDHYGDTALLKAVAVGDLNSTSLLIIAGSNVNHRNRDKTTPLHMAALGNWKEIVNLLLKKTLIANLTANLEPDLFN